MQALILDTATEWGVVALYEEKQQIAEERLPIGLQSSSYLLPAIVKLLRKAGKGANDLDAVIVGVGPGSYTGIRVAVAAAKGLVYPHHTPLVGVCTLSSFDPKIDASFAALIDARFSGVYYQLGKRSRGKILHCTPPSVAAIPDFMEQLSSTEIVVTPQKKRLQKRLAPLPALHWIEEGPDPDTMLQLGLEAYRKGCYSTDGQVDILYLRKTQAEIEREK